MEGRLTIIITLVTPMLKVLMADRLTTTTIPAIPTLKGLMAVRLSIMPIPKRLMCRELMVVRRIHTMERDLVILPMAAQRVGVMVQVQHKVLTVDQQVGIVVRAALQLRLAENLEVGADNLPAALKTASPFGAGGLAAE